MRQVVARLQVARIALDRRLQRPRLAGVGARLGELDLRPRRRDRRVVLLALGRQRQDLARPLDVAERQVRPRHPGQRRDGCPRPRPAPPRRSAPRPPPRPRPASPRPPRAPARARRCRPTSAISRSTKALICAGDCAPRKPSTGCPPTKAKTAGIDCTRICAAIRWFWSTSILTSLHLALGLGDRLLERRARASCTARTRAPRSRR